MLNFSSSYITNNDVKDQAPNMNSTIWKNSIITAIKIAIK